MWHDVAVFAMNDTDCTSSGYLHFHPMCYRIPSSKSTEVWKHLLEVVANSDAGRRLAARVWSSAHMDDVRCDSPVSHGVDRCVKPRSQS